MRSFWNIPKHERRGSERVLTQMHLLGERDGCVVVGDRAGGRAVGRSQGNAVVDVPAMLAFSIRASYLRNMAGSGVMRRQPRQNHSQDALGSTWRVDDAGGGDLVVLGVDLGILLSALSPPPPLLTVLPLSFHPLGGRMDYCGPHFPRAFSNSPGRQPKVHHQKWKFSWWSWRWHPGRSSRCSGTCP